MEVHLLFLIGSSVSGQHRESLPHQCGLQSAPTSEVDLFVDLEDGEAGL